MPKKHMLNLIIRIGLFNLILGLGIVIALVVGEKSGLALTDLSHTPVQTIVAAKNGDVLYTALNNGSQPGGVYRSDDDGRTWQLVSPKSNLAFDVLAVHPTNDAILYGGTAGGPVAATNNLWRSEDGGQTWHKLSLNLPANSDAVIPGVTALALDPAQPELLYVSTAGQGVYRFDVGSESPGYNLVGDLSLHDAHVNDLVIGMDHRVYALTNDGLFANDNESWKKLEALPEVPISLAVAPTEPQTLYAGGPSSGVYRSTNGGQSWDRIGGDWWLLPGAALRGTALAVDEQDASHVAVTTAYGIGNRLVGGSIYETYDSGRNWIKIADAHDVVTQLTIDDEAIYAAAPSGLVRYGGPAEPAAPAPLADLHSLTNPTGTQMLVLVLTFGLAGLVLLTRLEWIMSLPPIQNKL